MNSWSHTAAKPVPERARDVRACAWRYVFDCYEKHKAAEKSGGENHET
jgi:hypothetical protein